MSPIAPARTNWLCLRMNHIQMLPPRLKKKFSQEVSRDFSQDFSRDFSQVLETIHEAVY